MTINGVVMREYLGWMRTELRLVMDKEGNVSPEDRNRIAERAKRIQDSWRS